MKLRRFFDEYVKEAVQTMEQHGLTMEWGTDFRTFKQIVVQYEERYQPAKGFNPELRSNEQINGIWLAAFRNSTELVHTQACRRISISPNLHEHLRVAANAYEPDYLEFDLENMKVNLSPEASKIKGEAIYHGEAWIKGGTNSLRGSAALSIFSRMMIAKALSHWNAKYIFGLITPYTGIKGLPQRYGYSRCEQGAVTFVDQDVPNDLWLVWMTTLEAKAQLTLRPEYFKALLEKDTKSQASSLT